MLIVKFACVWKGENSREGQRREKDEEKARRKTKTKGKERKGREKETGNERDVRE